MGLVFEQAGIATSLQDGGRENVAHLGVPPGGAADRLSLALANWLVGKPPLSAAVEITLTGARIRFEAHAVVALAGGTAEILLNGMDQPLHQQFIANPDDVLEIGALQKGCRLYLAACCGFQAEEVFGSASTYAPGGFGGFHGRMLQDGDVLPVLVGGEPEKRFLDHEYIPFADNAVVVRAVAGPEAGLLDGQSREQLFTGRFRASQRASRQGVELDRPVLSLTGAAQMRSSAVFPGTVQCPPSGKPYLLLADAQTTGGYPRIAQVIRADRHLLGQVRPGGTVRFMEIHPEEATQILREKNALYAALFGEDIF